MRLFLVSWLIFFLPGFRQIDQTPCHDLQYEVAVHHTTQGQANGWLEVKIIKSSSRVKAFLYRQKGSHQYDKHGVKPDELTGLAAGKYILVLQNKQCTVHQEDIEIR